MSNFFRARGSSLDTPPESLRDRLAKRTHPLLTSEIQSFVAQEFPDYTASLTTILKPEMSSQPDELEEWETEEILKRQSRWPQESDADYLLRSIYEESFSVNQNPDTARPPQKTGSYGAVPGGLVSHAYFEQNYGGNINLIDHEVAANHGQPTLVDELKSLDNEVAKQSLVAAVTYAYNEAAGDPMARYAPSRARDIIEAGHGDIFNAYGYRLIRMLTIVKEMVSPVEDQNLKAAFEFAPEQQPTRAQLFRRAWKHFSTKQPVFDDNGTYRTLSDPGMNEAMNALLFLRTHPEMQIFYKYFSPSGFINSAEGMN